ncbi:hypothetical protein QUC31_004058 [Theobroma cacao]|uniref:Coiled-coil domain-containing protein 21, putative isoform 1 n=1 Tax=Theobroma cacao TaxID=3641 RepID=A0A061DMJ3_THECC|nr:Coiled-coil domain-containing protein 21, putative isoform 1 [Theobroma cacao]
MSFLAGRLAGKEAAFFFQESKHAVNRLAEKNPKSLPSTPPSLEQEAQADVLPEVLKHSLPSRILGQRSDPSSLSKGSKWALHSDPNNASISSPDAMNPLRAYLSLPQVTFGPKRWALPSTEHSVMASTANAMRKDKFIPINPEKLKAAAEGLQQIGKAFAVATAIVFGGATLLFGMAASKLELHNKHKDSTFDPITHDAVMCYSNDDDMLIKLIYQYKHLLPNQMRVFSHVFQVRKCTETALHLGSDDIRTKGKDLVQPKLEMIREQLSPIRTWAENMSKKWNLEREEAIKEKPIIKELSKILGAKTSN